MPARLVLLALTVVAIFWGFWGYGLFDLDEGIYAAALSEMRLRGDWLVPTYGGVPFFEKPILQYWAALGALSVGIPGEAALRLPSVLASLGTLLLVYRFARARWGETAALSSAGALALSPLFAGVGRMFMPDALLVFFLTSALLAFWASVEGRARSRWLALACLGAAVLAKGPMPVAVFLLVLAFVWLLRPEARARMRGGWAVGGALFLLVVAAWYVPVAMREGGAFFQEFVIRQNLGRLAGEDTAHLGPAYFYLPILLVGFAPFSLALPLVWKDREGDPLDGFLWAWALVVFVLFSVAGSKLPHYILPMFPPLALLLGRWQARVGARLPYLATGWFLLLGIGLLVASGGLGEYQRLGFGLAVACLLGTAIGLVAYARGAGFSVQAWLAAAPFVLFALHGGVPAYWEATHAPVRTLAVEARRHGGTVRSYRMGGMGEPGVVSHPSFQWYLGRNVPGVDWPDEALARDGLLLTRRGRLRVAGFEGGGVSASLLSAAGDLVLFEVTRRE
ncbi:MAG: glycosyltransferase family 39 protein [Armatimonadota bacterium]